MFGIKREDAAWAAGIFEGEGSWTTSVTKGRRRVRASVQMTDHDVVRRFGQVMGAGYVSGPHQDKRFPRSKQSWTWQTQNFQGVQHTYATLFPWLGSRRRARGAEILSSFRQERRG